MCSSRASLNFSPSQQEDEGNSDGLSGGDSLQLSFNKNEKQEDIQETSFDLDKQIEEEIKSEIDRKDKQGETEFQKMTHDIEENSKQKEVISLDIVQEINEYGYPERFIIESIENNEINYATASYYLLKKRAMIDNSNQLLDLNKELDDLKQS